MALANISPEHAIQAIFLLERRMAMASSHIKMEVVIMVNERRMNRVEMVYLHSFQEINMMGFLSMACIMVRESLHGVREKSVKVIGFRIK